MPLLPVFDTYPKHGELVARLVAGYSDLEIDLMYAVMAVRDSFDDVFKAMYRTRGEKQRIDIADAIARHAFDAIGLGTFFSVAIGALHDCRKIRNQFAHCAWYGDSSGYLKFVALEDTARENAKLSDFNSLTIRRISLSTLQSQLEYFEYVQTLLIWLRWEAYRILKSAGPNPHPCPKPQAQPDFHTP